MDSICNKKGCNRDASFVVNIVGFDTILCAKHYIEHNQDQIKLINSFRKKYNSYTPKIKSP